jgi:hypothetical protein
MQILLCCAATGCGLEQVRAPKSEIFAGMKPPAIEMPAPAALPDRPKASVVPGPGGPMLGFDKDAGTRLLVREQLCEANTGIARECAAGFGSLQKSYGILLTQAQLLEEQHNYMAQRWAEAETERQARDREQFAETWLTRFLLLGLAISVVHK